MATLVRKASTAGEDARALERELRASVKGEVRFSPGDRALYSTDASNYRQVPIGVVLPLDAEDVVSAVEVCRRHGAPLLSRGGGTSLAGQCCNTAVVLDYSKYFNRILEVDPERRIARVQPGVVLDDLRDEAERYHLTFGPDPATHNRCTLGGMIGNNSCGVHSIMAGKTSENVEELEVLTYDGLRLRVGQTSDEELGRIVAEGGRRGEIYRRVRELVDRNSDLIREKYPDIPRLVSGYNLDQLLPEKGFHLARALVGGEGTCVTVLEATVRLVPSPPARTLLVIGFPDIFTAADYVPRIMEFTPIGLEGFDARLLGQAQKKGIQPRAGEVLPEGRGWLLVEFGGDSKDEANARAHKLMESLGKEEKAGLDLRLLDKERDSEVAWGVRESGLGATARVPGEPPTWAGWEDAAVRPDRLGDYLREFRRLEQEHGYNSAFYGHFGDGCVHTRIDFDLETVSGIRDFTAFIEQAADLVVKYGGSLSGEHGDGQARAALLPKMFGPELVRAFGEFKAIWDPDNRMNPGKLVHPYRPDEHLRLGTDYDPPAVRTHFRYPEDDGSFAKATLRCVGVGKCRRMHGKNPEDATMCPSYMATREEMHSTRGRAHLLFEMLQGDPLTHGWREEKVRESLDLCLACKGCKSDCPVNVDMATYKAEFLSHYYRGRLRPRTAYSMGLIMWWARLASRAPGLANFLAQSPGLSSIAKLAAGVAQERRVPAFAPRTFKSWFRSEKRAGSGGKRVVLWADTFNNYLTTSPARAAVEVLEAAGYDVCVPTASLCCGRPLYDFGMLDLAERFLVNVLDALGDDIRTGTPVVGLEPSCVAVFRDELCNLLPHDEDARRLSRQTFTLAEFLTREGYEPPKLRRRAIVHGHCHQKAVMKMTAEEEVLERMGLEFEMLPSGCCGMAGAFGFESGEHYEVSVKVGERVLLPAVRSAPKDTLVIADGFSCRKQIEQLTDRRGMHLAEVLSLALRDGRQRGAYPERQFEEATASPSPRAWALAGIGTAFLAGAALSGLLRRTLRR